MYINGSRRVVVVTCQIR